MERSSSDRRSPERRDGTRRNSSHSTRDDDAEGQNDLERMREERRRAWRLQQERDKEHERLKQKKIAEYERKRAERIRLGLIKSASTSRGRDRDRSLEPGCLRTPSAAGSVIDQARQSYSNEPSTSTQNSRASGKYDVEDLQRVVVKINRNIVGSSRAINIQRAISNHDEVTVKRREGEGVRPIFDRIELQRASTSPEETRTIEAVHRRDTGNRHRESSAAVSPQSEPRSRRSPTPRSKSWSSRHRSRSIESSRRRNEGSHRESRRRSPSQEAEARQHSRSPGRSRRRSRSRSHRRSGSRQRSGSRHRSERSRRSSEKHGSSTRVSRDRSRSRERRDTSRNRRDPVEPYIEPVPYPAYYPEYPPPVPPMYLPMPRLPPGPMMRGPMPPPHPPYPPRYMGPPHAYRGGPLSDPRYRRM